MKTKKVSIIGYGYVGKALHNFFKDHYEVYIYDPHIENSSTKREINKTDFAFISVPTPRGDNGECDISIVEETVKWLKVDTIIIKSTVEIGTTEMLKNKYGKDIVFSPEYIGESSYWSPYEFHTDMKETPFFIFGGDKNSCSNVIDLFLPVTGPCKRYITSDSKTAEMAKYMENSFYATKITFCNEMYDICDKIDVDWNEVRELWLADPRINPMHTAVFKDKRGFSGKCLPKDTSALNFIAKENNLPSLLLDSVLRSNDNFLNKNKKPNILIENFKSK